MLLTTILVILNIFGLFGALVNNVLGLYYIGTRYEAKNLKGVSIKIALVLGQLLLSAILYALLSFGLLCLLY